MDADTLHGLSHSAQIGILGIPIFVVLAIIRRLFQLGGWAEKAFRILNGLSIAGVLLFILRTIGDGVFSSQIVFRQNSCRSNMKQVSLGLLMYANDWSDTFPPATSWADQIGKYRIVERDFHCPSAKSPFSYALNSAIDGLGQDKIPEPAETVLLYELDGSMKNSAGDGKREPPVIRHSGTAYIAYADGRVKYANEYVRAKLRWTP